MQVKSILITGAGGVLGQELIRQLIIQDGVSITALELTKDRIPTEFKDNNKITVYDIEEWETGKIPFEEVDTIVHCAFARSPKGNLLAESLGFTKELFSQAVDNKVASIINISSQSVYGQSQPPLWTEQTTVSPGPPDTFYALAKYSSELITSSICRGSKTIGTSLRLASLVGLGMDERLTSRFVKLALVDESIKLVGGNQVVAYMDVKDAAEGIIALIKTDRSIWKEVYNLGSLWRYTIKEIAEEVQRVGKHYGKQVVIEIEEKDVSLNTGMNSSLFYEDTGWTPKYDMRKIIKSLFRHYASS